MKKITAILFVLGMLASMVTPAFADTQGPVTGSFTTHVSPVTNGITIYDHGTTEVVAGLSPQQTYDIKVSITDNDGIGDLTGVTLKLWYDGTGSAYNRADYNNITDATTRFSQVASWGNAYNSSSHTYETSFGSQAETDSTGSTWAWSAGSFPSSEFLADSGNTSYDFIFTVKVGKVARETLSGARWHIAVLAKDATNFEFYKDYTDNLVHGVVMDWYGEVQVDPLTVDWGDVPLGMKFNSDQAVENLGTDGGGNPNAVTYISNGTFSVAAKSSKTWSTSGHVANISLNPTADNTFALKASWNQLEKPLQDGVLLPLDEVGADLVTGQSPTGEGGLVNTSHHLYLSVSSKFDYPGVYAGTITFVVHN